MKYTPLHLHSDASLLDGLSKTKDIAKRIVEIDSDGCALTDHGSVANCISFLQEMERVNKKAILGIELYISDDNASIKTNENRKCSHLVILAKNDAGWSQILKIVEASNKDENHYYSKPRLSLEQLAEFLDGNIIGFSGHLGSNVSDSFQKFGIESATKTALYLEKIFGKGNFWLECQLMDREHNTDQITVTNAVREISKTTGIPCIATPDAHYCRHSDAQLQRILLCSNMGVSMKEAMKPDFQLRTFFISDNYHIPTYEEMVQYGHTQEELENTNKILAQIEDYHILSSPKLPDFPCPNGLTEEEYFTQLCREGWKRLIVGKIPQERKQEYADRVKYELDVLKRNNLFGYFLIVWDIIDYCRQKGWLTGVGRGSAAGCLVSYLVGITKVDSVKYDLMFERFYNEGRSGSLPDIDSDFEVEHRDEIVEYIKQKYGADRVTQIITFGNLKGKKAISQVFSAYNEMTHEEVKRITANIIEEHKITDELQEMEEIEEGSSSILRWCLENRADRFKEWCYIDEDDNLAGPYADRFREAMSLEGVKANVSRHAAGVVVSKDKLDKICPMVLDAKTKKPIGGLTMNYMEAIGLCKMDILGLNFLDKMAMIARLNPAFNTDFNTLDLEDQAVWDLFATGKTKGCFQLDSRLGQGKSKDLKPECMEHLSGLMAVLRPGCLEAKLEDGKSVTEHYIIRKNLGEEVSYVHDSTISVLKATYGLLIYQESAMKLAQLLAGFDLKQADALRKAIGKKKADLMAKVKVEFIEGIEKQGIVSKEIGEEIFGWIEKSQRYSFNKSHSLSYALFSFMSAYAKTYFPLEFYTAYLYYSKQKPKPQQEIYELVNDAKSFDIFVQPPSILRLNSHFDLIDKQIYFGLSDIKHVGESVVEKLRQFIHPDIQWFEFLLKAVPPDKMPKIDSRAMESLINSGACDCFKIPRIKMVFEFKLWSEMTDRERLWIKNNIILNEKTTLLGILEAMLLSPSGKNGACSNKNRVAVINGLIESIHNPPYELVDKPHQVAQLENALLGICLTATFLDESQNKYRANCTCQEFNNGFNNQNSYISIACQIDRIKTNTIKNGANAGKEMAFITASDDSGICEAIVVFSDAWEQFECILQEGNCVLITGKRSDKNSLIVESVNQI
jgi:DNA polymerase III subunit alpha